MVRTVHGFQHELLALLGSADGPKTVLAVLLPVPASNVELLAADVGRGHLLVAIAFLGGLHEVDQPLAQGRTLR